MVLFIVVMLLCAHLIPSVHAVELQSVDYLVTEDTYIEENYPEIAPWNNRNLYLGTDYWYEKGKTRIFINPDFGRLQQDDILSTDIVKVELLLTSYTYEGTKAAVTIDAYTTTTPWTMETLTWQSQPSFSSKRDSTSISTSNGQKSITITNAFTYAYKNFPSVEQGIALKINAETEKTIIFWAHGCSIAPASPTCERLADRPTMRITYRVNTPPERCSFALPGPRTIQKDSDVILQAKPSIDSDNDLLTYEARVCTTVTCDTEIWHSAISTTQKTTAILTEGIYYIACKATDEHHIEEWGTPIAITIDTTPPMSPEIIEEPPYTGAKDNTISWLPLSTESVSYQVLSSERSDFRSYNTYSPWITATSYVFSHTKERIYYYKVRSKDAAGNESEWSQPASTIIDTTIPVVTYFKSNRSLLNPKMEKDGTIENSAYIQGGATEANTESLTLEIHDINDKLVFSKTVEDKSYLWIHWPSTEDFRDGNYIARLIITDFLGQTGFSEPILLTIDTTPPAAPTIAGIKKNATYRNTTHTIQSTCPLNSIGIIYLSGKVVASGKQRLVTTFTKNDGTFTLEATCTDAAQNKSSRQIKFTIDTKPPSKPTLTYTYTEKSKTLELKTYCREESDVIFYNAGHTASPTLHCKKNAYATYLTEKDLSPPFQRTYTVRTSDLVGNWSEVTQLAIVEAKSVNKDTLKKISCAGVYSINRRAFAEIACNELPKTLFTYTNTTVAEGDVYETTLQLHPLPLTFATITVTNCKPKSIWSPETWFSCVERKEQELVVPVRVTPIFTSNNDVRNSNAQLLLIRHPKQAELTLREQFLFQFTIQVGDLLVSHDFSTKPREQKIIPSYGKSQNPIFSWIFTGTRTVSQWHGDTAYQKPHKGIDFSVNKDTILAPANGTLTSAGYDKSSACYGGGNYIALKHENGMYTYYFHLKNLTYPSGKKLKKNDTVTRGTPLATSGNSGLYNCEPLAAHLHFEVRAGTSSSTHVNPVPYININWNTIATAKSKQYPGRLSGDNPHPTF